MNTLEAVLLGLVQGLTEFLPISSSGHLRFVPAFLGLDDPGAAFTAVTQLGTVAAVLLYFRRDLWETTRGFTSGLLHRERRDTVGWRMGCMLVIGTIPISVIGLALRDVIETSFRDLVLVGVMLVAFSAVMLVAERRGRQSRRVEDATMRDAALVGVAQALALVPGVSRSGATISAGLLLGFDRAGAARFSFLLSVPAVVLSGLVQLSDIGEGGGVGVMPTVVATIVAFVSGYASIALLLRYLVRHTITVFVGYRVIVGALVVALATSGAIN